MEEIELQLEENPDDLTVWREWLSYCRRYGLSHERYLEYLERQGILTRSHAGVVWNILREKDLDSLRGVIDKTVERLTIRDLKVSSTVGIEDFVAPKLSLFIVFATFGIVITKAYHTMSVYYGSVKFSERAELSNLDMIFFYGVEIIDVHNLYGATNLTHIVMHYTRSDMEICRFKGLTRLTLRVEESDNYLEALKRLGNSDTLRFLYDYNDLEGIKKLIDDGWYPNLEYPTVGKNKRHLEAFSEEMMK